MSNTFASAIADLKLVLPADKIAKLELLDDYDLIAPMLAKHKKAIQRIKSAPKQEPLEKRQAKAWEDYLAKSPSDDFKSEHHEQLRLAFKANKVKDTASFGTDKNGNPYIKVTNPMLIELYMKMVVSAKEVAHKSVSVKKVSGNRRERKSRGEYTIEYTNTPDNPEGADNEFYFTADKDIEPFKRDGKIADDINGGKPIKKVTYKAVRREEDFIVGKKYNVCQGAVQWERAMGSKHIKAEGLSHATFRLQCGALKDNNDPTKYCDRCQRKKSGVENFFEGEYKNGTSYVDFIVENTNTKYQCVPIDDEPRIHNLPDDLPLDDGNDSDDTIELPSDDSDDN